MIDEFGELKRREAEFGPVAARLRLLRETIASWLPEDHPGDQPATFQGSLYTVNLSIAQQQRKVTSFPRLFKVLGRTRFFGLLGKLQGWVSVLEGELGKEKAEFWLVQERTGSRTITAVAKASPAEPEAA